MGETTARKRKPVSAARIELELWFRNATVYRSFSIDNFAAQSMTVSRREWIAPADLLPDGSVRVAFRFIHECRNGGAQQSDSFRFFGAWRKKSAVDAADAEVSKVTLLDREVISA